MENSYIAEKWQIIEFEENISEKERYLISNHGRVKSLKQDPVNGLLIKPGLLGGYKKLTLMQKSDKRTTRYIHKMVAIAFIEQKNEEQKLVIHLDYNKTNNHISNLSWATEQEKANHNLRNPNKTNADRVGNSKLTEGRVKMIKRKLNNPNRKTRMKLIAKQFGISEMQLYRIKVGENWGYVTVD